MGQWILLLLLLLADCLGWVAFELSFLAALSIRRRLESGTGSDTAKLFVAAVCSPLDESSDNGSVVVWSDEIAGVLSGACESSVLML